MTHLPISPILDAAELMTNLEIQGCLDDSSTHYDIAVRSKKLLLHKKNAFYIHRQFTLKLPDGKTVTRCDDKSVELQ